VNVLGVSCFRVGDLGEAADAFDTALELATDAQDSLLVARASNNLGMIANVRGQGEVALSYYRRAIPTYQRSGRAQGLAETHHNIAVTCRDLEQLDEADVHEQRTIEYAAEGRAPRLAEMGRLGRGEIALRRGDADLAAATARHSVKEFAELHDPLNEADAWRMLGCALCQARRLIDSREAFAQALALARDHGHVLNEAETLRDRISLWIRLHAREAAVGDAASAIAIFYRLGAEREVEALTSRLGELRGIARL
jgi:tetratricopeptide (TPR) repeat protein